MADAFGRWLERVLGERGLVVYDSSDPAAKPLVSQVFARELSTPGADGEAGGARRRRISSRAAITRRCTAGRQPGAVPPRRRPPRRSGSRTDGSSSATSSIRPATLVEQAAEQPGGFSPNVLLRPIVQDTLFPTICYVAGPNELAYLGQLRGVYEHFGVPMPLMYPRASATLLDSAALRFLTKYKLPLEALQAQDEAALNALLQTQIPPVVEESFDRGGAADRRADGRG